MADITSDVTIDHVFTDGLKVVRVETPDTADDGDTIDLSSSGADVYQSGCVAIAVGNSDGVNFVDTSASGGWSASLTIPGSTDDEVREIVCIGV